MTSRDTSASMGIVTVVIVNYYLEDLVAIAVASVWEQPCVAEIIIVDNGSTSLRLEMLQQECPIVSVIESGSNLGFAAAANVGARAASSEFVFFLNPDATVEPGCIAQLVDTYRDRPGIVGPAIYSAANKSRDVGATMNHLGMSVSLNGSRPPLYVSGCALLTSRDVFVELGEFDDRYFLFVEDVELCWRALLAGYEVGAVSQANVIHEGGAVAQGGYFSSGQRYRTSALRVSLRERNTVALMISCAPWYWLPLVLPALLVRSIALLVASLCLGQPALAGALLKGIFWNVTGLRSSLARRRSLTRSRIREHEAARRFIYRAVMISMIWRSGVPKVAARGSKHGK